MVEDLVAEKEVSEQSDITVGLVEGLVADDVRVVSQMLVESVVLQTGCVEVSSGVTVDSVFAKHSLQKLS